MAAPTIYHNVAEGVELERQGQLFAGKKFWVAQRMPTRLHVLQDIKANGGEVVLVEKLADYLIADHCRRDCPPGSISYEFVDKSIEQGQIQDPEDHRCGPRVGEAREPGALNRPAKGGRAAYTAEEDRILYKWVSDAAAAGSLASGNEIYKQLESKYPRHTWQSWRDRYLKQLRHRPPSAFNIPDNAPPSPPSDQSNERTPTVPSSSKRTNLSALKNEQSQAADKVSGPGKARTKDEYTLDELAGMFSSDDWEELYAFVEIIDGLAGQAGYEASWARWAEEQDNQTAKQWQQYYEKVVRPQWLRDPAWKREQIEKKVSRKYNGSSAGQSQSFSQQRQELDEPEEESTVSKEKATEAHQPLETENERFEEDKTAYIARDIANLKCAVGEEAKLTSEVKLLSSSTARHESPKYLNELYEKAMKRIREDEIVKEQDEQEDSSRPTKRRRSASATPSTDDRAQQTELVGTQMQPLELASAESSSSPTSQLEAAEDPSQEQIRQDIIAMDKRNAKKESHIAESIESNEFSQIERLPSPSDGYDTESADDLPPNTPTPRAARQKPSNFDTQAILSSPSQDVISEPRARTDPQRSSSPTQLPESDASTTQSLQEFRRSLDDKDIAQLSYPQLNLDLRTASLSPTPSSSSSTGSGDPDIPLEAEEIDEFFDEQYADGMSNEFVVKALKRTRLRPGLAVQVLDAWKEGKPLPNQRGIWSIEDDEAVESGDGVAMARLEKKHTIDGWGGITERMIFLEAHRSR
ncbi:uncharacterized protein K460DRAFT_269715 [Cucurbitaria berberidis CBS 394.84]|uniref:DNA-binding protein RAP1 n=1 Tax=Cucurbitaria berberidis CBS 394.84 TaxID=1168544 RepID=A0A9P4GPF1_9PLEO|nr:uncharacterized protein K460DRAFT_269715 [Cucurbitaria berberidis CBS 394.84]KAF1850233.1 hypothetical protein K460DRAFT_269715 [Cucurbitaria berberidis CBS 394.84]